MPTPVDGNSPTAGFVDGRAPAPRTPVPASPAASGASPRSPAVRLRAVRVPLLQEPAIPPGLTLEEQEVYEALVRVSMARQWRSEPPTPLLVITDIGKDYDDLAAITVLSELHRLKLVQLRGVVANLHPADLRAAQARAALASVGLDDVPVARGTAGSPDDHAVLPYEFDAALSRAARDPEPAGEALLADLYASAEARGERLRLLCLSSLQDIAEFCISQPQRVQRCTESVHLQGGNAFDDAGRLQPDPRAANNAFNLPAAETWHHFIDEHGLDSSTTTRDAAFAAPADASLFTALAATGHPIGQHLERVRIDQESTFYAQACSSDPAKRFRPDLDGPTYLRTRTAWREGEPMPVGDALLPYLTKVVLYDAIAALGAACDDAMAALGALRPTLRPNQSGARCAIIGETPAAEVVPEALRTALSALLKGAIAAP